MTTTLSNNAQIILEKRYLQPNESPDELFWRVAKAVAEPEDHKEHYTRAFYEIMVGLDFLPNSPTLFNAGTGQGTLSACFKFDVPDSMDGIMEVARKSALVQKWGGGVGYVLSALRPKGAPVKTTQRYAGGPVSFMKLYHGVAVSVTQGGKRDGAQMAILHVDHPDISDFINSKNEDPQSLSTFNISVAMTDEAMISKRDLLRKMAENAWKTGDPGCYFIDQAERFNPTPSLGLLNGTNPCGEVPLLDNEPCNLGSINLGNFVTDNNIDWTKLGYTARLATRFLDNVVTINEFPVPEIREANLLTRKIGLGVMGWADMLALLGIHYDTEEAVNLGRAVMSYIDTIAREESQELAKERGVFPAWNGDFQPAVRNATRTCIAPTGTISILVEASSGIEPHFATSWNRVMGDGTILQEKIPVMNRLNGFTPKTSLEIDWTWHIKHQAAFQEFTNLAVSKTINMPQTATVEDIYGAYLMAWELGCKGVTVFRDGSRDGVLSVGTSIEPKATAKPVIKPRPEIMSGYTRHIASPNGNLNITINSDDGGPFEVFLNVGKAGSDIAALSEALGRLISLNLRIDSRISQESRLEEIAEQLTGIGGSREVGLGPKRVRSLPDAVAAALRKHLSEGTEPAQDNAGMAYPDQPVSLPKRLDLCPECDNLTLSHQEGCATCINCGYAQC